MKKTVNCFLLLFLLTLWWIPARGNLQQINAGGFSAEVEQAREYIEAIGAGRLLVGVVPIESAVAFYRMGVPIVAVAGMKTNQEVKLLLTNPGLIRSKRRLIQREVDSFYNQCRMNKACQPLDLDETKLLAILRQATNGISSSKINISWFVDQTFIRKTMPVED